MTPYVPIEDVAKHFMVSVSTVRAWVRKGQIPKETYIKVGTTYRFNIPLIVAALTKIPDADVKPGNVQVAVSSPEPVQLELDFGTPDQDL